MAGYIGFYAEEPDVELLHERLNADPEIAFILQDGPGHWRAVWQLDDLCGKTMLWHVPGGPLPLVERGGGEDPLIENPFAGWQALQGGMDSSVPYFGPGWPSTLLLELYTRHWRGWRRELLPLSGLGWYGRTHPKPPPESTRRWWRRLQGWMRRHAVPITRYGNTTLLALPAAHHSLQSGVVRDPYPLVR